MRAGTLRFYPRYPTPKVLTTSGSDVDEVLLRGRERRPDVDIRARSNMEKCLRGSMADRPKIS
jgi:hypothetical protein